MLEQKKEIYKYYNMLKNVKNREYIDILIIVKGVLSKIKNKKNKLSTEFLLNSMIDVSFEFGLEKSLSNKEILFDILNNSIEKFEELTWKDIITEYNLKNINFAPNFIVEKMKEKCTVEKKHILIAEAEKFSHHLVEIIESYSDINFTLITNDEKYFKLLKLAFIEDENVIIEKNNIYKYGFINDEFDLIFSFPNFGIREKINEEHKFISRYSEMIGLENLSSHLSEKGVLLILLPASISSSRNKELREYIQRNYNILEIVELPSNIFETMNVKTYLLSISKFSVDNIIVKKYTSSEKNIEEFKNTSISYKEFSEIGNWNVDIILQSEDEEWLKFMNLDVIKENLGELATIFRGKYIVSKEKDGNVRVVNISNVGEHEIDYLGLGYIEENERKVSSYILKDGDLLLTARGTTIKSAIFEEQDYPIIASSNIMVIRANDERLSTTFLKLFLDTPLGERMLLSRQQSNNFINLNSGELNNLKIPLFPMKKQKEMVECYNKELKKYKDSIDEASKRWNNVLKNLKENFKK